MSVSYLPREKQLIVMQTVPFARRTLHHDSLQDGVPAHGVLQRAQLGDDLLALREPGVVALQLVQLIADGGHDVGEDDWPAVHDGRVREAGCQLEASEVDKL